MSSVPGYGVLRPTATSLKSLSPGTRRSCFRFASYFALLVAVLVSLGQAKPAQAQGFIFVTSLEDKVSGVGGCSLQEAIYSANFDDNIAVASYDANGIPNFVRTNCLPGNRSDRIILPAAGVFNLFKIVDDIESSLGPTATPGIRSEITIEGNGSTLQWVGLPNARAFSISEGGNLTMRNLYIKGFRAKGGDGAGGGGGGLGAGGAIYVESGRLTVEYSTFDGNQVFGGNGSSDTVPNSITLSGGGGGLSGNGGRAGIEITKDTRGGGGGGGSRGNGGRGGGGPGAGGGGGGTLTGGAIGGAVDLNTGALGGLNCGGAGANADGKNAPDGACSGGGGGGGGAVSILATFASGGHGGKGNYGGGGGGAGGGGGGFGDGGRGGFGGGGGEGDNAGDGGYGGGGGGSIGSTLIGGNPFPGGNPGHFAGQGAERFGGGGAALGGAIFSHNGTIVIRNSTFASNSVLRGTTPHNSCGGDTNCTLSANGQDEGGAIFAVNGSLTVQNSTISGNQSTGEGAGIVVDQESQVPTSFVLENSILSNPSARECFYTPGVDATGSGNLIANNSGCPGVVSSADPLLGPLQLNAPGRTPTMAIPKTSPAFDAAEPASSLTIDQRGFPRPQENGFDIGAFELCVPQGLIGLNCVLPPEFNQTPPTEIVPLTIQVSPAGTGTTNPAVGTYSEALNSVVLVSAAANPGFGFVNWTGGVADPTNPATSVIIDQPKTITANFLPLSATLAGNIIGKMGTSNARVWTLSLLNNGPGLAAGVKLDTFTLTQTFGAACTPILTNAAAFPLSLPNLLPSQTGTTTVTLDFTGCAASARFTAKFTFSANFGVVSGFVTRTNQYQ